MATVLLPRCLIKPSIRHHLTPPAPRPTIRVRVSFIAHLTTATPMASSDPVAATVTCDAGSSDPGDVLVQYVVLRRDLIDTWPMGSVVTQGCHASVAAIWSHKDDPHTLQYCSSTNLDSMHKVIIISIT